MVFSFTERKGRVFDFAFRLLTSPFTFGVYIAFAMAIAFLASAQTGIPAYVLVPVCFMAVTLLDPPARLMKVRERRHRPVATRRLRRLTAANNNLPSELAKRGTRAIDRRR